MSRKIAVGFVIYGPEENFLTRVQEVVAQGFDVYIFDNSPWKSEVRDFSLTVQNTKYFTVGKNVGLGYGMTAICAQAYYAGNAVLLFFDQDTIFSHQTLDFIEIYYLNNLSSTSAYSAVVFNSKGNEDTAKLDCFRETDMVINSGSLFFLNNLKQLGWHNEKYFVDCVDYEFCLKSQKAGLRIGEYICTPGFDHSTEQADRKYKILGKQYSLRAYPWFRISDTLKASAKLVATAIFSGKFKFATKLCRLTSIYITVQLVVRAMSPSAIDKEL
jgi:rhamnosyltransferase